MAHLSPSVDRARRPCVMHFSWAKTPFPGQSDCLVAVLLILFDSYWRCFLLEWIVLFTVFIHVFNVFFHKSEKHIFYVFFLICKLMFLTSMHPEHGLTQPSILSGSVNEYRLRLGRYKAGVWCAPCTWAPMRWQCLYLGRAVQVFDLYHYLLPLVWLYVTICCR